MAKFLVRPPLRKCPHNQKEGEIWHLQWPLVTLQGEEDKEEKEEERAPTGLTPRDNERLLRILEGSHVSGPEQAAAPGNGKQGQGYGRMSKGLRIAQVGLGCAAAWACTRERFGSAAMLGGLAILPEVFFDDSFPMKVKVNHDVHLRSDQLGTGLALFGGATGGATDKDMSIGSGLSTSVRVYGTGKYVLLVVHLLVCILLIGCSF
jgi:hypothetical protein